jgi:hypothetical protein
VTAAILELAAFEEVSDPFVGIEVGGIAGQPFEVQPLGRARREEIFDRLAGVDRGPVPDHEQLAPYLAQELAEERNDRGTTKRLLLDVGEELTVGSDGADHGEMVVGEGRAQDGRLPHRRVGAGDERQEIKARLIYEEERAVFGLGFAKRAGQRSACHAAI